MKIEEGFSQYVETDSQDFSDFASRKVLQYGNGNRHGSGDKRFKEVVEKRRKERGEVKKN